MFLLLKFEIILTRKGQIIRLQNGINFSETPSTFQMVSFF